MNPSTLERAHHFLRTLGGAKEVGIIDRDHARLANIHFAHHLINGTVAELEPVHQRLAAERTALVAAARGLHERTVDIAVFLDQVIPRRRQAYHRVQLLRLVSAAHLAALEIVQKLIHHKLNFPDHHRVAMLDRFLCHKARVHTAHHDRDPASPENLGDLVAAVDVRRHRREPDEVGLQAEIAGFDVLVGKYHLIAVARNRGCHGYQAREGRVQRPIKVEWACCQRMSLWIDEMYNPMTHMTTPPRAPAAALDRKFMFRKQRNATIPEYPILG